MTAVTKSRVITVAGKQRVIAVTILESPPHDVKLGQRKGAAEAAP